MSRSTESSQVERKGWWGIVLTFVAVIGFGQAWSNTVSAAPSDTVFVCKFVGTPGVDEVLQTGDNPIRVSVSAIPLDPVVEGSFFADAQGRSFVLAFDVGQPEPDVSECPQPELPATTTTTPPTSTTTGVTLPPTGSSTSDRTMIGALGALFAGVAALTIARRGRHA